MWVETVLQSAGSAVKPIFCENFCSYVACFNKVVIFVIHISVLLVMTVMVYEIRSREVVEKEN